jgi:WD40 repeat protein
VHKKDIFDVNWSEKNPNLLLSSSADQTVALWNISIDGSPLQIFPHPDIVASAVFKVGVYI